MEMSVVSDDATAIRGMVSYYDDDDDDDGRLLKRLKRKRERRDKMPGQSQLLTHPSPSPSYHIARLR